MRARGLAGRAGWGSAHMRRPLLGPAQLPAPAGGGGSGGAGGGARAPPAAVGAAAAGSRGVATRALARRARSIPDRRRQRPGEEAGAKGR